MGRLVQNLGQYIPEVVRYGNDNYVRENGFLHRLTAGDPLATRGSTQYHLKTQEFESHRVGIPYRDRMYRPVLVQCNDTGNGNEIYSLKYGFRHEIKDRVSYKQNYFRPNINPKSNTIRRYYIIICNGIQRRSY